MITIYSTTPTMVLPPSFLRLKANIEFTETFVESIFLNHELNSKLLPFKFYSKNAQFFE